MSPTARDDAIDFLPDAARLTIVDVSIDWPRANVRRKALEQLADLGDRQLAHDRALRDPSARIREWAPSLLEAEPATPDEATDPGVETATDTTQESLF